MKKIETQFGISQEADFEKNTWTFLMPDNFKVRAGSFAIVDKPVYDEMNKRTLFTHKDMEECWEASLKWHYANAYGSIPNRHPDFKSFMLSKEQNPERSVATEAK